MVVSFLYQCLLNENREKGIAKLLQASVKFPFEMSSDDNDLESLEETFEKLNKCKERNRLRLLNLKRMVKTFSTELSRNTKVLPNYSAQTFKQLNACFKEVMETHQIFLEVL